MNLNRRSLNEYMITMPALLNSFASFGGNKSLLEIITDVGLTANLKLCLDAGDALSYTSGQKWLDRSGGGYDFFLGASASVQSSDPTFNGIAGRLTAAEYFSLDGGDYFKYDTSPNAAWMDALNQNSAKFSYIGWVYLPSITQCRLLSQYTSVSAPGIALLISSETNKLRVIQWETTNDYSPYDSAIAIVGVGWHFLAFSVDELMSTCRFQVDAAQDTNGGSYINPGEGRDPSGISTMFADPDGVNAAPSGTRVSQVAMWQGVALTAAQLTSIYEATKGRFV